MEISKPCSGQTYHVALDERRYGYHIDFDLNHAVLFTSFTLFAMPISAPFTAFEDSVDLVGKVKM